MLDKIIEKYKSVPIPVKTSIIYMICSVLQKGVSFISVPLFTRIVLSDQYGTFTLYQSWESILSIIATLNLWNYLFSNGMIKYSNRKDEFTSSLIGVSSSATLLLLFVFVLMRKEIMAIIGLPIDVMLLMFIELLTRPSYEFWCARQRFEYNIKKSVKTNLVISFLTPIFTYLLLTVDIVEMPDGVKMVAGKVIIAVTIYLFVEIALIKKCHKLYDKEIWQYSLKYNIPLLPHFLSSVILAQLDKIMIGAMCGSSEAAIYSVAYSIAAVMLIVNSAVMDSIIPWMYKKMAKKDYTNFTMIGGIGVFLIALMNLFICISAPEIIKIMAPAEYSMAMYIIPPVAMSNVLIFMFNLYANIEYFFEETKLVTIASCIAAVANVVLNYIFINLYGYIAAGYTTIVCYLIYAVCHQGFMKYVLKKHGIKFNVYKNGIFWMISITALVLGMLSICIYKLVIVRYIIFVVMFGGILLLIHPLLKIMKEKKRIE